MTTSTAREMRERRAKGVELMLPEYGDVVRIRPMDVSYFVQQGRIPDFLADKVQKFINSDYSDTLPSPEVIAQKQAEWLNWLDSLTAWAVVEPKVVTGEAKNEDEISISDIGYYDKVAIYLLFGRPASQLARFHDGFKSLAPVDASKDNGANPQQNAGDTQVGE